MGGGSVGGVLGRVLEDELVVGVDLAGLGEEGVGVALGSPWRRKPGGLLDEVGDAVLADE